MQNISKTNNKKVSHHLVLRIIFEQIFRGKILLEDYKYSLKNAQKSPYKLQNKSPET